MDAWSQAELAASRCDVLIVVGTSAVVYPAAGLIHLAAGSGAKVIIVNQETTGASDVADIELLGSADDILPEILADK